MKLKDTNKLSIDKSVIVIEDEKIIQTFYKIALDGKVAKFLIVSEGKLGLRKIREDAFDIVITDIGLPDIDGITLAKLVKEYADNITVIGVSMDKTIEAIKNTPENRKYFDGLIEKPLTEEDLEKLLIKYGKDI